MRICLRKSSRGIALMVVMIAIFVLSVLAGAFAYAMKVETKLAMNAQKESFADSWQGAVSGVESAKWVLALMMQTRCGYTSLNQKWAGGTGEDCETNGPSSDYTLAPFSINGQVYPFSIKITDLDSKININMASDEVLQHALMLIGFDGGEIPAISSSILDWIDPNVDSRIHRINGAKSDYYQGLIPPYKAKNGPMDDLSELLLVKGIRDRPEMYSPEYRPALFQQVDRHGRLIDAPTNTVYLVDVFTALSYTVGGAKVDLNTTSVEVLEALGVDEALAIDLIQRRDQSPFHSVAEAIGPNPQLAQILNRYCSVQSHTFKVEVTVEGSKRKYFAIIGCNNIRDIQTLSFYWRDPMEKGNSAAAR